VVYLAQAGLEEFRDVVMGPVLSEACGAAFGITKENWKFGQDPGQSARRVPEKCAPTKGRYGEEPYLPAITGGILGSLGSADCINSVTTGSNEVGGDDRRDIKITRIPWRGGSAFERSDF